MSEMLTQVRAEDVIAETSAFLEAARGTAIDGGFASLQVTKRVMSNAEWAEALLTSIAHPKHPGLYVPLSVRNADYYHDAVTVLPGHMVLLPSTLLEPGTAAFYPAVVSEDSLTAGSLRLHVLRQPFRRQLGYGTATILSAAGQSETQGIGSHDRTVAAGVEAEHFATLLAAGSDARQQAPDMRLSYDLQPADWNNPAVWSGLGDFDWIYFNPPYLIPGQKTRSGYEQVPASHMYIDDPRQTYVQVVQQCLPRLAYGASMMCRLPVDDGPLRFDFFDREQQRQMTVGAPAGLISIQSLMPVAGDRSRKAIVYTAAENALPPYGDPRAMILAKHGYDFHALTP